MYIYQLINFLSTSFLYFNEFVFVSFLAGVSINYIFYSKYYCKDNGNCDVRMTNELNVFHDKNDCRQLINDLQDEQKPPLFKVFRLKGRQLIIMICCIKVKNKYYG